MSETRTDDKPANTAESSRPGHGLFPAATVTSGVDYAPRDYRPDAMPIRYPDKDIIVLDQRFAPYLIKNAGIQRLYTGALWAEGPAWNGVGKYLVWSDIPNNFQLRWLAEDGHVSVFRNPSNNSNGNTFDFESRQVSCEHGTRRVVRYEHNGTVTVLADKWQGKQLNSPNDVVVHPDGGIWFTDPPYGSLGNYEGNKGELFLKDVVYRIDPKTGAVDMVTDEPNRPNGICFSPDYKKVYVSCKGTPAGQIMVWDLVDGKKLANGRVFASMTLKTKDGDIQGGADGLRSDTDGNIWVGGWGGEGYDGVHIMAPDGQRIGQIVLPEAAANICFGGPKRNRLFIAASSSIYALYVGTQGAHIT